MRFLLVLLLPFLISARDIPNLTGPVIDEVGIFTSQERQQLSSVLQRVYKNNDIQLQVFIAKDMGGDQIENFSIRTTDTWKLGSAKGDKGLLFVIAMAEKKVRIEVGQGLEGVITDAQAGMLIQSLTPYFKRGEFAAGTIAAVNSLLGMAGVEEVAKSSGMKRKTKSKPIGGFALILIILFIIFEILMRFRRGTSLYMGGHGPNIRLGGGGGFSGGGGWSGGGGGFSGGGASGGW